MNEDEVDGFEFDEAEAEFFTAARTCAGVTEHAGPPMEKKLSSSTLAVVAAEAEDTARSIAPRKISKRVLTSPVKAATFFVKRVKVTIGRNCFMFASGVIGTLVRVAKRDCKI